MVTERERDTARGRTAAPREGEDTKQVEVLLGPYAGKILTMPTAEADQAITDHWAREPNWPPLDANADPLGGHGNLDEAERAAAEQAANDWAQAQLPNVEPTTPVEPAEDEQAKRDRDEKTRREQRDMTAGNRAGYDTRDDQARRPEDPRRPPQTPDPRRR